MAAAAALDLIDELEPGPRRRYAAPVGWLDTAGDGEFAIALRCAEIDGRSVRLTAGCGIMAGSDPAVEAREAQIKMVPIRDALESGEPDQPTAAATTARTRSDSSRRSVRLVGTSTIRSPAGSAMASASSSPVVISRCSTPSPSAS